MEKYGQSNGYILYRTRVNGRYDETQLSVKDVRDVAYVYIDGTRAGAFSRLDYGVFSGQFGNKFLMLPEFEGEKQVDVLVEALGRVNYGEHMPDLKGISGLYLNRQQLMGFEVYTLPLDNTEKLVYSPRPKACPAFMKGELSARPGEDCFVDFRGFIKGCIFINGFNLGRYWNVGPQRTLYVPGAIVKDKNEIVVFELEGYEKPEIYLTDKARWDV